MGLQSLVFNENDKLMAGTMGICANVVVAALPVSFVNN